MLGENRWNKSVLNCLFNCAPHNDYAESLLLFIGWPKRLDCLVGDLTNVIVIQLGNGQAVTFNDILETNGFGH